MNNFLEIIKNRNSCRSFINEEISSNDIDTILDVASNAPSGANMQPFNIYHVSGDKLKKVTNDLIEYVSAGNPISQDIQYYPVNWINPYKKRRLTTGAGLYELLKIDRKDKEKREEQWFDNFKWFNSQNVFFFTIDKQLIDNSQGMLIDSGILLQTMILASESLGYKCCPQGATTEYGHIIKKSLGIEDNEAMLFSLVVGKPTNDLINTYRPIKINYKESVKHIR